MILFCSGSLSSLFFCSLSRLTLIQSKATFLSHTFELLLHLTIRCSYRICDFYFFFSHVETSVSPEAITPAVVEFFFFLLISVLSVHLSAGLNSVQFQARRTTQECPGRQNSFYDFLLLFLIINILCCPQNNGSINSSVLKVHDTWKCCNIGFLYNYYYRR